MNFSELFKDLFVYDLKNPLLFNSGTFFVLFSFFLILYTLIHKRRMMVTLWVIFFSFFFYYKSSGWYFLIPLSAAFADFYIAREIDRAKTDLIKRVWLITAITLNLALLAYFKYPNFLLFNISAIVGNNFQPIDIFLPIGISFHTFQSISYMIDVYRDKMPPCKSVLDYAFFLSFFPQLVAGPIVKANHFLPQMEKPITIKKDDVYSGLWLIIVGLFKKAVIADYIAQYNDLVFANPEGYSGFENLMAIYGYTLQIYCDFSGYSDMAIGLGRMMGFDLGVNFNLPYKSKNITDFWRRWHISLSSWLRDYLYFSLGGNKKGKVRMYVNLFLTMFLGGLWHGSSWRFVFWGAMHGIALAVHKGLKHLLDKIPNNIYSNFFSWFLTFHFVIFLWIFFRANDIQKEVQVMEKINGVETAVTQKVTIDGFHVAWSMVKQVTTNMDLTYIKPFLEVRYVWFILLVIGYLMHASYTRWNEKISEWFVRSHFAIKLILFILIVQLVIQFKLEDVQPFIYFQF